MLPFQRVRGVLLCVSKGNFKTHHCSIGIALSLPGCLAQAPENGNKKINPKGSNFYRQNSAHKVKMTGKKIKVGDIYPQRAT